MALLVWKSNQEQAVLFRSGRSPGGGPLPPKQPDTRAKPGLSPREISARALQLQFKSSVVQPVTVLTRERKPLVTPLPGAATPSPVSAGNGLSRDSRNSTRVFEFCSGLVDLVVCVGCHGGGGHRFAFAGE